MHEGSLKRFGPKPPPDLAATTFVNRIFGGKLRSQVGGHKGPDPSALAPGLPALAATVLWIKVSFISRKVQSQCVPARF